jgi:Rhodopirellula transposase DDE domain
MISSVRQKYQALAPLLHENAVRCWAACEARSLGRGGISLVATATELSRPMIRRGIAEIQAGDHIRSEDADRSRVRRPGCGCHPIATTDRTLFQDLKRLIDPATPGYPKSPLLWTCKSTRTLAEALASLGHDLSYQTVGRLDQRLIRGSSLNEARPAESHRWRSAGLGNRSRGTGVTAGFVAA